MIEEQKELGKVGIINLGIDTHCYEDTAYEWIYTTHLVAEADLDLED